MLIDANELVDRITNLEYDLADLKQTSQGNAVSGQQNNAAAGTAFATNAPSGTRQIRTDLNFREYHTNGTAWLIQGIDYGSGVFPSTSGLFVGYPFIRTDIQNGTLCNWDGTRWLGPVQAMVWVAQTLAASNTVTTNLAEMALPPQDIYITGGNISCYVLTTNTATKYWAVRVRDFGNTVEYGRIDTSTNAANTLINNAFVVSTATATAAKLELMLEIIPVGTTPGAITNVSATIYYRPIYT